MLLEINIPDDPNTVFSVSLDGRMYDIKLQYNDRDESWYMNFGVQGKQPLFRTKITVGADLLIGYLGYDIVPKGLLYVVDIEKGYGRLDRLGWSSGRYKLRYLTSDELP
jgi:hypothetical protein